MKKSIFILMLLLGSTAPLFSQTVKGEILSDTNNVAVIRLWGTSEERGFAYGYLAGDKVIEVLEGFIIPYWGDGWPTLKGMVEEGKSFQIDSMYWHEAQAMMDGATAAGYNPLNYNALDILAANLLNDVYAWQFSKNNRIGFHCSALMNWNEATADTDLEGRSVISRHMDAYLSEALYTNVVIIIHIPSEPDLQPWLLIGNAGEMAPASGINSSGLSIFANGLGGQWNYSTQAGYEPYAFTFRKALEKIDYNQDGTNNMLDIRDAISSNPIGYGWGSNFSALAPSTAVYDSLIALVAEVAPEDPYITFRDNSYNDTLPGDNLYAANSQIKRNDSRSYCNRYLAIVNNIGDGTRISSQENWDLMKNHSNAGNTSMQFMQYIPEWDQLKLSVYQNNTPAYLNDPVTWDVNSLFKIDVGIPSIVSNEINIYPTPAIGIVNIKYRISGIEYTNLSVFDVNGKKITTFVNQKQTPGEYTIRFDASDLSTGIYLIRLQEGSRVETTKLIIMN